MLKALISWLHDWFVVPKTRRPTPQHFVAVECGPVPADQSPPEAHAAATVNSLSRKNATARLINAFDSAHPVRQRKDLHGRDDKLETLFDAIIFNRQHAIIHGARGSGKTSLAQVFGDHADQQSAIVIYTACEAAATFAELLRPYLMFIPDSAVPFSETAAFHRDRDALAHAFGPREIVDFLSRLSPENQIVFILDEFDRVERPDVSQQIATLMKLMSDARLPVQILIVGIAQTLDDLIDCHPSLRRHLVPIPIGRISGQDSETLIDTGALRAGVEFDAGSKAQIISISCGSPYHVQLFCYVSAIEALKRAATTIDLPTLRAGLQRASEAWAMLNPSDAELFEQLVDSPLEDLALIERAARQAAAHDSVCADDRTVGLLRSALRENPARPGSYTFRDSAAPQFLLAQIALKADLAMRHVEWFDRPDRTTRRSSTLPIAI